MMRGSKASRKNVLIAFDAFGTLFSPRAPIGALYGEVARKNGICKDISDDQIMSSFKKAFEHNAKEKPNYGKEVGMDPTAWWSSIITQTFTPFLTDGDSNSNTTSDPPPQLPSRLIPDLLTRFASSDGYALHPDVIPLFTRLRDLKQTTITTTTTTSPNASSSNTTKIITAVLTNSDDRVAGILRSFGLRVGHLDSDTVTSLISPSSSSSSSSSSFPSSANRQPQGTLLPAESAADNDVDFVLTSYDCGFEKPDRGIFDAAVAVARARFAAAAAGSGGGDEKEGDEEWETVYVGDEVDKDVLGAEEAGWKWAFLIDREVESVGVRDEFVKREGYGEKRVLRDLMELEGFFEKITG